ncbi:cation channel sperm-associated auxiliary subunit epsilon-like [Paroedura picta]|uniref:cation channel sperm-associated auxiliary subunit epsilon-like n=1 Tax=Paroedura picta TaxID=143630 RepID=UPI004055A626
MGQSPDIKTRRKRITFVPTAFPEEGFWKVKVPAISYDITADIQGKAITFQDCFVADTPFTLTNPEINFFRTYEVSISSPPGSDIILSWSSCVPTKAVLVTESGTFLTVNGFKTSEEIKFPSTVIDRTLASSVTDVALGYDSILFLIQGSVYYVTSSDVYRLGGSTIPDTGIKGIRGRMWCAYEYPKKNSEILSEFIIWTEDAIFLGRYGRVFFQIVDRISLKNLLGLKPNADVAFINTCYDSIVSEISFLIACTGCTSSEIFLLAEYDEEGLWFLKDFFLPAPTNRTLDIIVVHSAVSYMLLWDKNKIYYTYKENRVNGYVKVFGTDRLLSAASEGTTIQQIIIDHGGNTIIKMKNNVMYFFKFKMKDVIKLHTWENENKNCIFYVNPLGGFYLLTVNGSNIHRQVYPLKTEVFSATQISQEVCPYISFQHNMKLNVYYVDMKEHVTFWTQIVFLENLGLFSEITIHKPNLLKQKTYVNYEIARGICTKNKTITFYHDQDYSHVFQYQEALNKSEGIMIVELQPSSTGRQCTVFSKISYIYVGCPPSKHVAIEKPSVCKDENFTFSIPGQYLLDNKDKDLEVKYNKELYGCLIDVFYEDPFRPTVALYKHKKFVKFIESEYVLWEINGRTDFLYNATMAQVHCLREAQSWSVMYPEKEEGKKLNITTLDQLWGPHNYQSCFQSEHGETGNLKQTYEIMNHSGINSIIWPTDHSGIYLFKLKILDPNFSFCDFSIYFAIRTYGIAESPNNAKIAGWSVFVVCLFLGVLLITYFRYVKIFRAINSVDPPLSLHSHLNATDTAEEMKKEE